MLKPFCDLLTRLCRFGLTASQIQLKANTASGLDVDNFNVRSSLQRIHMLRP